MQQHLARCWLPTELRMGTDANATNTVLELGVRPMCKRSGTGSGSPIRAMPKAKSDEPTRQSERSGSGKPNCRKSKTGMEKPKRATPNTGMVDSRRTRLREVEIGPPPCMGEVWHPTWSG